MEACGVAYCDNTNFIKGYRNDKAEILCKECMEGFAITTFQNSVLSYFSNTDEKPWEFHTPNRNIFEIHNIKGRSDDLPAWGTAEWILTEWVWFGVRCVYHISIAMTVEVIREGWINIRGHDKDYGKDFREGNVSHRLTPLFKEYWGMEYNPDLKPTMEKQVFNWIRSKAGLG